jgi:hypothetical protein
MSFGGIPKNVIILNTRRYFVVEPIPGSAGLEAQLLSEFDGKSALAAEPDQRRVPAFLGICAHHSPPNGDDA